MLSQILVVQFLSVIPFIIVLSLWIYKVFDFCLKKLVCGLIIYLNFLLYFIAFILSLNLIQFLLLILGKNALLLIVLDSKRLIPESSYGPHWLIFLKILAVPSIIGQFFWVLRLVSLKMKKLRNIGIFLKIFHFSLKIFQSYLDFMIRTKTFQGNADLLYETYSHFQPDSKFY